MNEQIVISQEQLQQMAPAAEGIGLGMIIIMIAVYIFWAYCIARIAVKMGMPFGTSWIWAIIPIANVFLVLKLAEKPWWWFFLLLVPILNIVMTILIWMSIADRLGKPTWWGVCIALVPILNIILFLMLCFESSAKRPAAA